jgi:hypothetical protein
VPVDRRYSLRSITSSAFASSEGGKVRPECRYRTHDIVLTTHTNSNIYKQGHLLHQRLPKERGANWVMNVGFNGPAAVPPNSGRTRPQPSRTSNLEGLQSQIQRSNTSTRSIA